MKQVVFLTGTEAAGYLPLDFSAESINKLTRLALRKVGVPEPSPREEPPAYSVLLNEKDGGVMLDIERWVDAD